jgi:hypothetical protein
MVDIVTAATYRAISHFYALITMNSQELVSKYGGQDYYTVVYVSIE